MDNSNITEPVEKPVDEKLCINCQANRFEEGFKTKLCYDCRQQFINYPIPKWIMIFGACILVIMLVGMVRMPVYFSSAIHLSRAEKAMDAKRYLTAQNELQQVVKNFPDNLEARGKLLIASGHNFDMAVFGETYDKIAGKTFTDESLLKDMDIIVNSVQSNYPKDTLLVQKIDVVKDSSVLLLKLFDTYTGNEDFLVAGTLIADRLFEMKDYTNSEKLLNSVLAQQNDFYPALSLLTAVKRNLGKFDEAIAACDKILAANAEDVGTIAQKARIELKRKKDAQAAIYAEEAMKTDATNLLAMEAKAMVDFYAKRQSQSLKLLAEIKQKGITNGDTAIAARLRLIINGSVIYR